tara:strand:- start:110 stop:889 length:780 start_codon:yes stop_codon:yes gene_type:complete
MAIVTLTTDLGSKDFYTASIKGKLHSLCPAVTIIDITHEVPPFDIEVAAFCLKNSYSDFPVGTIHIIGVNPIANDEQKHVIVQHNGHFFIGADNGVFSLIFEDNDIEANVIESDFSVLKSTFPAKDVFAKAAAHIASGNELNNIIGKKINLQAKSSLAPITETDSIRGLCIYIDSMGNITTNITKALFMHIGKGRPFEIGYRRNDYSINTISINYDAVPEGEKVAIFNNFQYLEIAINKGSASKLFGMKRYDTIRVDFK